MHDSKCRDPRLPVIGHIRGLTSGWTIERLWLALIVTLYVSSLPVTAYRFSLHGPPTPEWSCLIYIPMVMFCAA